MKNVIAVAMSDLHARSTNPACRTDNYFEAMKRKIQFIADLCEQHRCPLIDGGDLFDTWKGNPKVESMLLEMLPQPFFSVAGNHEMPYHNSDMIKESSFNVLRAASKMHTFCLEWEGTMVVVGHEYSRKLPEAHPVDVIKGIVNVAVYHGMVWLDGDKPNVEGVEGVEASELAAIFKDYDFVICGHNHETFTQAQDGLPTIINPGSVMRSSIAQINHRPSVFLLHNDKTFTQVFLPIEQAVFAEEVYKQKADKKHKLEAFVEQLIKSSGTTADFAKNLETFMSANNVNDNVRVRIQKILEACKCQNMKN